jgi:hypothetical protein
LADDGTIHIAADPADLLTIIDGLSSGTEWRVSLDSESGEQATGSPQRHANALHVRPENEAGAQVRWNGDHVVVTGEPSALSLLAGNIDAFRKAPLEFGNHLHLEYFPGHFYLRADSVPVIVEMIETGVVDAS